MVGGLPSQQVCNLWLRCVSTLEKFWTKRGTKTD